MARIEDALLQYRELCSYCDALFERVRTAYPGQVTCARGCVHCCSLKTVCALEIFAIGLHLKHAKLPARRAVEANTVSSGPACVFLHDGGCTIYPARPIICRTHGLPLVVPGEKRVDCCPLNFTSIDLAALKEADVMDVARVTTNLMRLNLAFCTVLGDRGLSGRRFHMTGIAAQNLPPSLHALIDGR
jgi:Fe-S-cluster containining protein